MKRLLAAALLAAPLSLAFAQEYPNKPIRVVIPYPPGGVDITARLIAPGVEKELGQPWVLDYRPGATGLIGQDHVARSAPDGYTITYTLANTWVIATATRAKPPFDPVKDFSPITLTIDPMGILVANNNFPPNNLRDMVEWTKQNPGKAAWATSGIGSSWHINSEMAKKLGNFDVLHTPFQGFGPMVPAILNGQVPMGFFAYTSIHPMITSGKMKVLGIAGTRRFSVMPQVMTFGEQGFQGFDVDSWIGIYAPARLPPELQTAWVNAWRERFT